MVKERNRIVLNAVYNEFQIVFATEKDDGMWRQHRSKKRTKSIKDCVNWDWWVAERITSSSSTSMSLRSSLCFINKFQYLNEEDKRCTQIWRSDSQVATLSNNAD